MRRDLSVRCESAGGREIWTVGDPLSLRFCELEEEEFFALSQLDGHVSAVELKRRIERRFPGRPISDREIEALLHGLHRQDLLRVDTAGQGVRLWESRQNKPGGRTLLRVGSLLSFRLGGVNPRGFLNWLYPRIRWLFSPISIGAMLFSTIAALLLVLTHLDAFINRLPAFDQFFALDRAPLLLVCLAVTKCLHELGHALMLAHFHGTCRRIGIMLLVFTPSLYCDVSDAWRIPDRRRRALVGAAGIGVDLALASLCTFVWWFTVPGLLHYLCLYVMFICSAGTLLFNANPLLRFDGYYVLSDLWGVSNLWQRSRAALSAVVNRRVLGLKVYEEPLTALRRGGLITYAVASIAYSWSVLFGIGLFMLGLFTVWRMERIGYLIVGLLWATAVVEPIVRGGRFLFHAERRRMLSRTRLAVVTAVMLGLGAAALMIPWPYYVEASATVRPLGAQLVYVEVGGFFNGADIANRTVVRQGQVLAVLVNAEIEAEFVRVQARRDQKQLELDNLKRRLTGDPASASRIPAATADLADAESQLAQLTRERQRMQLVAPCDGIALPPPALASHVDDARSPFDDPWEPRNRGRYLPAGTAFCRIAPGAGSEAVLTLDADAAGTAKVGQAVLFQWDALPGEVLAGTIVETASQHELHDSTDGSSVADNDGASMARPGQTSTTVFYARVALEADANILPLESVGRAKIRVGSRSAAARLADYFRKTFDFH